MKLWIDDIRQAPDDSWTVARTVTSAIRAIARFNFEEISLDHDISHQITVGTLGRPYPCEECFCAVAYYLAEKYWHNKDLSVSSLNLCPKIIIHTSSPVGAKEIEAILKDAGIKSKFKRMGLSNRLEMEI